jgi:hypothetical protein
VSVNIVACTILAHGFKLCGKQAVNGCTAMTFTAPASNAG